MTGSFRLRIGIILVVGIISVVIGDHFGVGDHFDGGDHFGGGTRANTMAFSKTFVFRELTADKLVVHKPHDNKRIFVRKKTALCFKEYK